MQETPSLSPQVCSTDVLYHYLFNPDEALIASILEKGLRPLSDFPESDRWKLIQGKLPGFFEWLYREFAQPVIQKPYTNSGIFLSPIDFRLMPESLMFDKPRINIPIERLDPEWSALSYEHRAKRVSLPLTQESLQTTAKLWTAELVKEWFGVDNTKLFYYVPQVVTYQPNGIRVSPSDIEDPNR